MTRAKQEWERYQECRKNMGMGVEMWQVVSLERKRVWEAYVATLPEPAVKTPGERLWEERKMLIHASTWEDADQASYEAAAKRLGIEAVER